MAKKKAVATNAKRSSGPSLEKKDRPDRDRRVRQADRLARVLRVLELIQSRGRWTTKAIADEIECSERTVYRDLDVLKFAGIPKVKFGRQDSGRSSQCEPLAVSSAVESSKFSPRMRAK